MMPGTAVPAASDAGLNLDDKGYRGVRQGCHFNALFFFFYQD
jgi:hypothetical protein